ncbi:lipocalin family protein [Methylonatrum kenyense]|uniref:lipocalin family protein n=1 Tax=Methylonatrum kenyense TaxID=455253 RepID=UPI0020BE423C|nr:lipocalin family protein [Methylonatrum kenyense]MCK8517069.1 lipocalin family protein [Methylonatrum kenyense]
MHRVPAPLSLLAAGLLAGCQSTPPMPTVDHVDLDRYMGDWYVIANIPTYLERDAHNAVESYSLNADGTIDTVFTFRQGGFDGEKKRYNPTGFVRSDNNAEWGMQFIWPIKAEFLVIWLDEDYTQTVIGRSKRDYVWIMAREPEMADKDLQQIIAFLGDKGYDTSEIQMVPQQWD